MERLDTISSDPNVNSFLQHIRELEAKTSREDEEIAKRLEEEIAEGRRRRKAYREAQDRSLSPAKDRVRGPSNTFEGSRWKSPETGVNNEDNEADRGKELRSIANHLIGDDHSHFQKDSAGPNIHSRKDQDDRKSEPVSSAQVSGRSIGENKFKPPIPKKKTELKEAGSSNTHNQHVLEVKRNLGVQSHRELEHPKQNDLKSPPQRSPASRWNSPRSSFIQQTSQTRSRGRHGFVEEDDIIESIEIRIANPIGRDSSRESANGESRVVNIETASPSPSRSPGRRSSHRPTSWLESALKRSDSRSPVRQQVPLSKPIRGIRDDNDLVRSDSMRPLRHSISHDGGFGKASKPSIPSKPQQIKELGRQPRFSHYESRSNDQQKPSWLSGRPTSFYGIVTVSDTEPRPHSFGEYGGIQENVHNDSINRGEMKIKPKPITKPREKASSDSESKNTETSQPVLQTKKPRPEIPSKPTLKKKATNEALSSALGQLRPSTSSKYIPKDEVMETLNSAMSKLRSSSPTRHAATDEGKETLDSAMSHLRPASPTKYVAPDVVKETLTGAMSQLRPSSPQKTITKDEGKEALVSAMGNLKHSEPVKQQPKDESRERILIARDSLRLSPEPKTPPVKSRTFGGGSFTASPILPSGRSSTFPLTERPNNEVHKTSDKATALGVHPALEQLLMRGPPSTETAAPQSVSVSHDSAPSKISIQPDPNGKKLEHLTKGRAKGPSRRKPKQKDTAPVATFSRPAIHNRESESDITLPKLRDRTTRFLGEGQPPSKSAKPLPRKPSTAIRKPSIGGSFSVGFAAFEGAAPSVEEKKIKPKPRKPSSQIKKDNEEKADPSVDTIATASGKTFSNAKKLWEQKSASATS